MKHTKKFQEMKVYGRHACQSLFLKRPQDLIRAYVTQETLFLFKDLVRYCADHKLAYHVVETPELDSVTRATHHEGIALVVKAREWPSVKELFSTKGRHIFLALEEVENPHNLGAILRSCAHFGVTALFYQAKVPVAQTAAAYRTSEGGAECLPAVQVLDWKEVLELAKSRGYKILSTSSHEGESLFKTAFPEKTLLFLGAESQGLSPKLLKSVGAQISIPGTGGVESLNVSNATSSILTEWYRQGL